MTAHDLATSYMRKARVRRKLTQYSPTQLARAAEISLRLRREREAAFYGDVDLIPSDVFKKEDATRAIDEADEILQMLDAGGWAAGQPPQA